MSQPNAVDLPSELNHQTSLHEGSALAGSRQFETSTHIIQRPLLVIDSGQDSEHPSVEHGRRMRPQGLSLSRYLEPLFVYWRWMIASLLLSLLLGWATLLVWPRSYESEAKLQLLVGRESVGLDPSSTTTQTLMMQKTLEEDVNSALELLGSREITQRVVEELGAENILEGYLPASNSDQSSAKDGLSRRIRKWATNQKDRAADLALKSLHWAGLREPVSPNEYAVIHLQNTVSVSAPKKSSTMIVSAISKSPEMSQAIVQAYTRHFTQKYSDVTTTEGSRGFFAQQAAQAEAELQSLMETRSTLLQSHQMASANSRSNILTTQLAAIETTIINTEALIEQSKSELDDLNRSIRDSEAEVVSAKQTQPDQAIVGMRNSLYAAELEEKRRATVYKEGHPLLVQIQQQVVAAQEALARMEQESQSLSTTPNPTRQKLEEDLLKTQARVVGLTSLLQKSQKQLHLKQNEINDLLKIELQLDELDRKVELSKKSLAILREKEEQARVVDDLRKQRISSVGTAQSATLVERAVSPNKTVFCAAFLMLGLGTGLGLVGLREMSRKTIRSSEDVERWLGYPVLCEIPRIRWLAARNYNCQDLKSRKLATIRNACQSLEAELILADRPKAASQDRGMTIGMVGLGEDSGTSLIAATLALELSSRPNHHTTLVDLDMKKRTVSRVFGLEGQPGIVEFAAGRASPTECVHSLQDHEIRLLGSTSQQLSQLGGGDVRNIQSAIDRLVDSNDCVLFDFPPASRPDHVLQLVKEMDQLVIVIRAETTDCNAAVRWIERIERSHGSIAGIVLTHRRKYVPRWVERILG